MKNGVNFLTEHHLIATFTWAVLCLLLVVKGLYIMSIQEWSDKILVVDLQSDPEFTDEIGVLQERTETQGRHVVLNFSKVKFLNSSNISLLLKLRKLAMDKKMRLILCDVPVQVWGVFLLTGLDSIFDVAEDTASALAAVQMN